MDATIKSILESDSVMEIFKVDYELFETGYGIWRNLKCGCHGSSFQSLRAAELSHYTTLVGTLARVPPDTTSQAHCTELLCIER
jgi:hypothetical protein